VSDGLDGWGGAEFVLAADRLDTPDVIEAADPGDMLRQVASAAAQVRTALRSCAETDLSAFSAEGRPRAIVVAGVGGSALAGEMLNALAGLSTPVQVVVSPAERLPGWVGATDAVVAVSSSGATQETLALAAEAARRGCRLAGVGAAGSPLHRIAEQARAPFGDRQQRDGHRPQHGASRLEEVSHQCRPASESFVNPGKSLALDLVGALPMVWGTSALSRVAARRFAGQLHENAKYPALWGVLPEAAHTQVAAFDGPFAPRSSRLSAPGQDAPGPGDASDMSGWELDYDDAEPASGFTALRLILIADPDEDQRVAAQRAAVTELAGQRGVGISELAMDGEHPLVRLAGVIQLTDYASVYLAVASGIDPGQTVAIHDLQARIE